MYSDTSEHFDVNKFWAIYKRANIFEKEKKLSKIAKYLREQVNIIETLNILTEKQKNHLFTVCLRNYFDDLIDSLEKK